LLKIYHKLTPGGALAKVAYLLRGKSLDLARFLLISKRALVGGIKPVGLGIKAMKLILTLIIVGALCLTGRAGTDAVLRGIRIVETQDQLHPPRGKLGERGPYQFRRSTWRMHTSSSFELAENREVANTVAARHYAWIEAQLRASGIKPSSYNVALAWNAGVNAVIRGNAPAVAHDYAARVLNVATAIAEAATVAEEKPTPPKPAWQAPILVLDETPTQPNLTPEPEAMSSPVPVTPATNVVASVSPSSEQDNPIEVRYYANSIMLALNRTVPPTPVNETPSVPSGIVSNSLLAADIFPTIGRL
jgi:hypothetical protein